MALSFDATKNLVKVTVSTGYTDTDTAIVLTTGQGAEMPTPPFNATWWNSTDYGDPSDDPSAEIVRVTGVAGDTLTILRAQENTVSTTKNTATKTYSLIAGLTALAMSTIANALIAHESTLNQLETDIGKLVNSLIAQGLDVPEGLEEYLD